MSITVKLGLVAVLTSVVTATVPSEYSWAGFIACSVASEYAMATVNPAPCLIVHASQLTDRDGATIASLCPIRLLVAFAESAFNINGGHGNDTDESAEASIKRAEIMEPPVPKIPTAIMLNTITLRFSDHNLERGYVQRGFTSLYPVVMAFCASFPMLCILLALAVPACASGAMLGGAFPVLVVGVMRYAVVKMADQASALLYFEWTWVGAFTVSIGSFSMMHARYVLISGLSESALVAIAALIMLYAVFLRALLPHHTPRLVLLAVIVTGWASFTPPLSELGQPTEPLLTTGALLVGELVGHVIDLQRKRSFLEKYGPERVQARALEASAKAAREREHYMALRYARSLQHITDVIIELHAEGPTEEDMRSSRLKMASQSFESTFGVAHSEAPGLLFEVVAKEDASKLAALLAAPVTLDELPPPRIPKGEGGNLSPVSRPVHLADLSTHGSKSPSGSQPGSFKEGGGGSRTKVVSSKDLLGASPAFDKTKRRNSKDALTRRNSKDVLARVGFEDPEEPSFSRRNQAAPSDGASQSSGDTRRHRQATLTFTRPDGDRRRMRVEVTDLGREPAERRERSHSTSDEASSNSGSDVSGHHVGGVCLLVVCHDLTGPLRDAEREVEKQAFKVINHTSKRVMTNTAQVTSEQTRSHTLRN